MKQKMFLKHFDVELDKWIRWKRESLIAIIKKQTDKRRRHIDACDYEILRRSTEALKTLIRLKHRQLGNLESRPVQNAAQFVFAPEDEQTKTVLNLLRHKEAISIAYVICGYSKYISYASGRKSLRLRTPKGSVAPLYTAVEKTVKRTLKALEKKGIVEKTLVQRTPIVKPPFIGRHARYKVYQYSLVKKQEATPL